MRWLKQWRKRWRVLLHRGAVERELDEEIAFHLEMDTRKNLRAGMDRSKAERQARLTFGAEEAFKEGVRESRWFGWVSGMSLDFKVGTRRLLKYPGLTVMGGFALAVAIAIGAGVFEFFNSYFYATLPLPEGDRIVAVENWDIAANNERRRALYDFTVWQKELKSIDDLWAFRTVSRRLSAPGVASARIQIAEMTASGFTAARVPPRFGRHLLPEDDHGGGQPVLVIGHEAWTKQFAADPAVIGREVRLGATLHTIIGVMPPGFGFPMNHQYWTPLRTVPSDYQPGQGPEIHIAGRLAAGVTREQAQAELDRIGQAVVANHPATHQGLRPVIWSYVESLIDIQGTSRWWVLLMQFLCSLVLVPVVVNVAIFAYARTIMRQDEMVLRTALGASRRRIIAQLFAEALVLSLGAAVAGLILARFGLNLGHQIMHVESGGPLFWMSYRLSPWTVGYAVVLAVLSAAVIGLPPAFRATGQWLQPRLRDIGNSTGMRLGKTWTTLIVLQVAIAVGALSMALAIGWNQIKDVTVRAAFPASEFLALKLHLNEEDAAPGREPGEQSSDSARRLAARRLELVRDLEREPGVAAVTFAAHLPGREPTRKIELSDLIVPNESALFEAGFAHVGLDFFRAFDRAVLFGRSFEAGDLNPARHTVIVNRAFVQQVLNGQNPLGRHLRYADSSDAPSPRYEIVGVVDDLHRNIIDHALTKPVVYHPFDLANATTRLTFLVRGQAPLNLGRRLLESTVKPENAEPDSSIQFSLEPLASLDRQQWLTLSIVGLAVALLVLTGVALSAAGVYSLTSFTVAQRRREIAIRSALGANSRAIFRAIFLRVFGQLALGIALGAVIAATLELATAGELLTGRSLLSLTIVSILMLTAGIAATLGPVRRSIRIPPMEALRAE